MGKEKKKLQKQSILHNSEIETSGDKVDFSGRCLTVSYCNKASRLS